MITTPDTVVDDRRARRAEASTHGWRLTLRRFRRKKTAVAATAFVAFAVVLAIGAPWIAPYGVGESTDTYWGDPSKAHWLGTNNIGFDTYSQLLFGLRTSLLASSFAVVLALIGGLALGLTSGYFGGRLDRLLMRFTEGIMVIPELILAIVIIGILGPGVRNAMIGIGIGMTPGFARLIRGQVLGEREEVYVEAAEVAGAGPLRMLRRHIVPNILPFLVVQFCMSLGFGLLAEGGLAFLGLSAQPPETSLGAQLQAGFMTINTSSRLIIVPGLAITLLSIAFNLIADGLRDSLAKHDVSDLTTRARVA